MESQASSKRCTASRQRPFLQLFRAAPKVWGPGVSSLARILDISQLDSKSRALLASIPMAFCQSAQALKALWKSWASASFCFQAS